MFLYQQILGKKRLRLYKHMPTKDQWIEQLLEQMKKFKFKVNKLSTDGSELNYEITISADDKLSACAKLNEIYPRTEYKQTFICDL